MSPLRFPSARPQLRQLPSQQRRYRQKPELARRRAAFSQRSLAAAAGAGTRELMVYMGHASPQTALIYQHASAERDPAIAAAISKLA